MGKIRNAYKICVGISEGKIQLRGHGLDHRIKLKWILEKSGGRVWSGFIWFRIGTSGGLL
jgi:hypothetical protein